MNPPDEIHGTLYQRHINVREGPVATPALFFCGLGGQLLGRAELLTFARDGTWTLRGHATLSPGAFPSKNAVTLSMTRMPMPTRVSREALPRWGSSTTFSIVSNSSETFGSHS